MDTLAFIIGILLLGLLWLDGARAREIATRIARSRCELQQVQFLDGTVSLKRIGFSWGVGGMRLRRRFHFEYSLQGVERRTAYLVLVGTRMERIDLGLPEVQSAEVISLERWKSHH